MLALQPVHLPAWKWEITGTVQRNVAQITELDRHHSLAYFWSDGEPRAAVFEHSTPMSPVIGPLTDVSWTAYAMDFDTAVNAAGIGAPVGGLTVADTNLVAIAGTGGGTSIGHVGVDIWSWDPTTLAMTLLTHNVLYDEGVDSAIVVPISDSRLFVVDSHLTFYGGSYHWLIRWSLHAVSGAGLGAQLAVGELDPGDGAIAFDAWSMGDQATIVASFKIGTTGYVVALIRQPDDTVVVGPPTTGLQGTLGTAGLVETLAGTPVFYGTDDVRLFRCSVASDGSFVSTDIGAIGAAPQFGNYGKWIDADTVFSDPPWGLHRVPPVFGVVGPVGGGFGGGIGERPWVATDGLRAANPRAVYRASTTIIGPGVTAQPAIVLYQLENRLLTDYLVPPRLLLPDIPLRQRQRNDGLTTGASRVSAGKNAPTSTQRSSRVLGRNSYS